MHFLSYLKMYNKSKPTKFGIKMFVFQTPWMVMFNSVTYTGKLDVTPDSNLLKLMQVVRNQIYSCTKLPVIYQVYCDMYYSVLNLQMMWIQWRNIQEHWLFLYTRDSTLSKKENKKGRCDFKMATIWHHSGKTSTWHWRPTLTKGLNTGNDYVLL
jgi:hypothetical protein